MDDLISRQQAISEIMEDIKDRSLHDDPATPEDYAEGYDEGIRNAAAIVLQMPSAQPDCTDCIKNGGDWNCDHVHCHKGISIQPEIIRCKDCKFYSPMNRETKTGICNLIMHQNFGDNWFCAGAERRPDE